MTMFSNSGLRCRTRIVLPWFVALVIGCPLSGAWADSNRPNVVLIIADDMAWSTHGFMKSSRELPAGDGRVAEARVADTPNLDALAAGGVTFTRAYSAASTCRPALQTLLSAHGHRPQSWRAGTRALLKAGVADGGQRRASRYHHTLPRELARLGYRSWQGGKMWEGTYEDAGFTDGMAGLARQGFGMAGDGFAREGWSTERCGSTKRPGQVCPALTPLREFLDDVGDAPFFVWFAPKLPHGPFDAPAPYRIPSREAGLEVAAVRYLANVKWFDEVVGELMALLAQRNLVSRTLVVYLSDNGWDLFQSDLSPDRGKGSLYDLGFRTPLVLHQPGVIESGKRLDDLVSFSDVPTTILEYVGAPALSGAAGRGLRSRVEGRGERLESPILLRHRGKAVVTREWRYLRHRDEAGEELYRIDEDPFELHDVAREHPTVLRRMRAMADPPPDEPRNGTIMGRILDRDSGRPFGGAEIEVTGPRGLERVARVEPDGTFRITDVPGQGRRLAVRGRAGVEDLSPGFVTSGPGLFFELRGRSPDVGLGNEVSVTGSRRATPTARLSP